jgi:hypothetical protein
MGPHEAVALRAKEKTQAEALVLDLTPKAPDHITYKSLWAAVLTKHAVRVTDLNAICASLKKEKRVCFPQLGGWQAQAGGSLPHAAARRCLLSCFSFTEHAARPYDAGSPQTPCGSLVEPLLATRDQCSFFGHSVSSFWWLSWQPAIRRLLQRVSRARRAYPAKGVHRDLLAPPEFQLLLSVRRLTCV